MRKLKAVRAGSRQHLDYIRAGWSTHHVDGQIVYMEGSDQSRIVRDAKKPIPAEEYTPQQLQNLSDFQLATLLRQANISTSHIYSRQGQREHNRYIERLEAEQIKRAQKREDL